jgi:hypothetical protein
MENLTRSEFGSKKRVFSHVDFLSTTNRITKDSLSLPTESLSHDIFFQVPCTHHRHTIRTYDMCYRRNLTAQPIHVKFVFIYHNDHGLLCATTIMLGGGETTARHIVRDFFSRDQLIIPLDSKNESLLVSIRKIQIPKKNDSDADRYCCLLKAVSIPSSWGPRENPWSLKEDELMGRSITPNEVIFCGRMKKRPITFSMEVVRNGLNSIRMFSANTPNPPEWHHNTYFSTNECYANYKMMIPDETNPYVLLKMFQPSSTF